MINTKQGGKMAPPRSPISSVRCHASGRTAALTELGCMHSGYTEFKLFGLVQTNAILLLHRTSSCMRSSLVPTFKGCRSERLAMINGT
jgi:hypothetical protein